MERAHLLSACARVWLWSVRPPAAFDSLGLQTGANSNLRPSSHLESEISEPRGRALRFVQRWKLQAGLTTTGMKIMKQQRLRLSPCPYRDYRIRSSASIIVVVSYSVMHWMTWNKGTGPPNAASKAFLSSCPAACTAQPWSVPLSRDFRQW